MSRTSPQRSVTPPRCGRSPPCRPRTCGVIVERVIEKAVAGSGNYPVLTKTKYYDWAALMCVMLQVRGLWLAVMLGTRDVTEYWMALEVLTKAIPVEMMGTIASKPTAKIAWDVIKVMNIGVERVRKVKAGTLWREFDALKFHDGESVDDLGIRINRIINQLVMLGDGIKEEVVVRKFLQALPARFEQIASSIETLLDLSDISVEELIGLLKATEEWHNHDSANSIASLNLIEDELVARLSSRLQLSGGGGGGSCGGGSERGCSEAVSEHGKEPALG
jgi:hypothetical protein